MLAKNAKGKSNLRYVPATFSNFMVLWDLAKKLCREKEYMQAFHQLEHSVFVLQMMNMQNEDADIMYPTHAADVLDDMACIMQLMCDYGKAHRYLVVRLQTLTGVENPLLDDVEVDENAMCAVSDTYSALFTVFNLQAVKMQGEGDLRNALEAFKSALNVLDRCCYITGNYVQVRKTRRNIASVLRAMKREEEALEYDAEIEQVNVIGDMDCAYTNTDKIFFRPTHGGAPELYLPGVAATDVSSFENRQEIKNLTKRVLDAQVATAPKPIFGMSDSFKAKAQHAFQCLESLAVMAFLRKQEDSDRVMQELLEEEEEEKKRMHEKKPNKNKKRQAKKVYERKPEAENVLQEENAAVEDLSSTKPVCAATSPLSVGLPDPQPDVSEDQDRKFCLAREMTAYLEHFLCPISLEIMEDPVMTADGSSYERKSIEAWFQKTDRDPLTNEIVSSKVLIPNKALKSAIQAARALERAASEGEG